MNTRFSLGFWVVLLLCVGLGGCASIAPMPVANFDAPKGIPYYDGSYYLLVYPDGIGNLKWTLQYLADPQKKREYRTSNFLSSVETELTFSNGVLTVGNTTTDSTVVPAAVIGAIEKVLTAGIANDPLANVNQVPAPSIYKLVVADDKITFLGEKNKYVVNVTVTQEAKPAKEGEK